MDNTFYTLRRQELTTLSAQAAWAINCLRKFSSGALVFIGLVCLGLGALTPTTATKEETQGQDQQRTLAHRGSMPLPELPVVNVYSPKREKEPRVNIQSLRKAVANEQGLPIREHRVNIQSFRQQERLKTTLVQYLREFLTPYCQDIVEGTKIVLMTVVITWIELYFNKLILRRGIIDASPGFIWAMAARWDNKKEKQNWKDIFPLFIIVLLQRLSAICMQKLGITNTALKLFLVALNQPSYVLSTVLPLLIYLSRPPKKST